MTTSNARVWVTGICLSGLAIACEAPNDESLVDAVTDDTGGEGEDTDGATDTQERPSVDSDGSGDTGTEGGMEDTSTGQTTLQDEAGDTASTGPCSWVPGVVPGEWDVLSNEGVVVCDDDGTATLMSAYSPEMASCGLSAGGEWVRIELPPSMQQPGEYDLAGIGGSIRMGRGNGTVTSAIGGGTLTITRITDVSVQGHAVVTGSGKIEGYDWVGTFEARMCD
ncbi:MAG: hypothetical protein AAF721_11790 [Myxococcota bacterium]